MADITTLPIPSTPSRTRSRLHMMRLIVSLLVPLLLTIISIRLVMTPIFLNIEYHRPGFPEDFYGFALEDRLRYAPLALEYLLNGEAIDFLADLRLPIDLCWNFTAATAADCPMYHAGELRHMEDVKLVTTAAFGAGWIGGILGIILVAAMWRRPTDRVEFFRGLFFGGWLTISLIAGIVILALAAWDTFFTGFHQLFFESGTWRFAYSDTLIRLFPEQFWFDAALTIGGMVVTGAGLIAAGCGIVLRKTRRREDV